MFKNASSVVVADYEHKKKQTNLRAELVKAGVHLQLLKTAFFYHVQPKAGLWMTFSKFNHQPALVTKMCSPLLKILAVDFC